MIVSHLLLILHKKIQFYIFMFEAWNVAKGCKVQRGRILLQGTVYPCLSSSYTLTGLKHWEMSANESDRMTAGKAVCFRILFSYISFCCVVHESCCLSPCFIGPVNIPVWSVPLTNACLLGAYSTWLLLQFSYWFIHRESSMIILLCHCESEYTCMYTVVHNTRNT